MARIRISVVQYLNTAPLVRGFVHGPLQGKHELSFTVPSLCADALRTGAVDTAVIPATVNSVPTLRGTTMSWRSDQPPCLVSSVSRFISLGI
jgi:hypothetical protein